MTVVEIVVVDICQELTLVIIELLVVVRLIERDAWMEHRWVLLVANKQYLAMQVQETIHHVVDIAMVLVSRTVLRVEEVGLYLALGIQMLWEEIDISVVCAEEVILHILSIIAEGITQEDRADIWLCEAILVKLHAHVPEVLHRVWHSRREVTAEAPNI